MVDECDVDEFILLYIKTRIECDGKYEWYEAPFIKQSLLCEKCAAVCEAARFFEEQKIGKLRALLTGLIDRDRLTYNSYRCIFDDYISMLTERGDANSCDVDDGASAFCFPLLALIAFTGVYARHLAELDFAGDAVDSSLSAAKSARVRAGNMDEADDVIYQRRDFRREIYQLSIYASQTLQRKMAEFGKTYGYGWNNFVDETRGWLADVEARSGASGAASQTFAFSRQSACVALCATAAAAALILFYQRNSSAGVGGILSSKV